MRKYNVEMRADGNQELMSFVGDYIEAASAEEAAEAAKDLLKDRVQDNSDDLYTSYVDACADDVAMSKSEFLKAEFAKIDSYDIKVTDIETGETKEF